MPTRSTARDSVTEPNAWRGVIAALANPESRRVLGLLLAEQDATDALASLPVARRDRVVRVLSDAGVIDASDDGRRLRAERFTELLASSPVERPTGLDRFIVEGRLDHYPARTADRELVLRHLLDQALPDVDDVIDERTLTERLAALSDDPVTMRRYLVDAGLVDRAADGSTYRRVSERGDSPAR